MRLACRKFAIAKELHFGRRPLSITALLRDGIAAIDRLLRSYFGMHFVRQLIATFEGEAPMQTS